MGKPMKKKPIIRESYCMHDRRLLPLDKFYVSYNPWHGNGVLPYCADCCNEMVYYYLERVAGLEGALWLTCAEVGVPFIKDVYVKVENSARTTDSKVKTQITNHTYKFFGKYMNILNSKRTKTEKYELFMKTDVPLGEVKQLAKTEEALLAEAKTFEINWGKQDVLDYEFLEYRYDVYTEGMTLTVAQDKLYRDLCLAELAKRRLEESGDSTKDAQAQILTLMKILKIDNFKENADKTLVEQMLEKQISIHEQYEPMEYYEDKNMYKDIHGYDEDLKHINRSIRNLVAGTREYPNVLKIEEDDNDG